MKFPNKTMFCTYSSCPPTERCPVHSSSPQVYFRSFDLERLWEERHITTRVPRKLFALPPPSNRLLTTQGKKPKTPQTIPHHNLLQVHQDMKPSLPQTCSKHTTTPASSYLRDLEKEREGL